MIYASLGLFAAFWVVLYYLRDATLKRGKAEATKEIIEATNEAMASRPLTADSIVRRLRELAANKADNKPDGK